MSCTCFREAIVAVGVLVLMEGIITIIIVVVYSYRFIKRYTETLTYMRKGRYTVLSQ